jgi:hypothetical protein
MRILSSSACAKTCWHVLRTRSCSTAGPATFLSSALAEGHYIKERTKNAQFVINSLRNNMSHVSDITCLTAGPATFLSCALAVGHYIKERTKNAQFVIISLRNNMFELADRLVGIYKTDNATKTVTINPHQFVVGSAGAAAAGKARGGAAAAAAAGDAQEQQDQQQQGLLQQQQQAVPV